MTDYVTPGDALAFREPECSRCGADTSFDGTSRWCENCGMEWTADGKPIRPAPVSVPSQEADTDAD